MKCSVTLSKSLSVRLAHCAHCARQLKKFLTRLRSWVIVAAKTRDFCFQDYNSEYFDYYSESFVSEHLLLLFRIFPNLLFLNIFYRHSDSFYVRIFCPPQWSAPQRLGTSVSRILNICQDFMSDLRQNCHKHILSWFPGTTLSDILNDHIFTFPNSVFQRLEQTHRSKQCEVEISPRWNLSTAVEWKIGSLPMEV